MSYDLENLPIELRSKPSRVWPYFAFTFAAVLSAVGFSFLIAGVYKLYKTNIADPLMLFYLPLPFVLFTLFWCYNGWSSYKSSTKLIIDCNGISINGDDGSRKYLWRDLESVEYVTFYVRTSQTVLQLRKHGEINKKLQSDLVWNVYDIPDDALENLIKAGINKWGRRAPLIDVA